jgi:tetratricopeptide (TPR) repeat protein
MSRVLAFIVLLSITLQISAQDTQKMAREKAIKAIELMDNGQIEESIELLKEADRLHPDQFDYKYEIAYAYYIDKNYKKSIKVLNDLKTHPNVSDRLYQLLGNSYDYLGDHEKAFKAYDEGLGKFPNSGVIYLEIGNVYWGTEEYLKALPFYEKGIELDPTFSSNYYRAAKIYCNSQQEVWGMIYGEIFLNLERNSERTAEISQLLYETYKSQITITSDTEIGVSFCGGNLEDGNELSFGLVVYEPTLMLSIIGEREIDMKSLNNIRTRFLERYPATKTKFIPSDNLMNYQKEIQKAGHLEAYNYWILMKGDETTFQNWATENEQKWNSFIEWFTQNGITTKVNL